MNICIRTETPDDYYAAELVTQRAFWNLHVPGCDEHYLVHKLRQSEDYIPELTRVAEHENRIIGAIYYSRSYVLNENGKQEVLTFGPLCVDPEFQKKGVGGRLLSETMELARNMGFTGIVIYGEPEYYPRFGFVTCDRFGITTPDGKNFPAFMAKELCEGGFEGKHGRFFESKVFEELPPEKVAEYNLKFPFMEKKVLPGQWGEQQ